MPNINISWEDKKYYNNTSSTSYGNPVTALVSYEPDGRPSKSCLTKAGIERFYGKEEAAPAPARKTTEKSSKSSKSSSSGGGVLKAAGKALWGDDSDNKPAREPRPLSPRQRYWLDLDIESHESYLPHVYIKRVVEHYYVVKKISPELREEINLRDNKLKEFVAFMKSFPVPEDPLDFLYTIALLESINNSQDNLFEDAIFRKDGVLIERMESIMESDNSPLKSKEVQDIIWELEEDGKHDKPSGKFERKNAVVNIDFDNEDNALVFVYNSYVAESVAFEHAITIYYNNLIEKGDIEAFGEMLKLYNKKKRLSADFLEKFQLPIKEEKDAVDVYKMLTNEENRKKSSLKKKLKELKEIIIANNYKDDILVSFLEKQNELELRNKAKTYKLVKYISLAVCIIASPMLFFLPIVLWYVVFCVKDVHSKIPFLVKGEEAVESVKKIDGQSIKG